MSDSPNADSVLRAATPAHESDHGKMSLGAESGASITDVLDLIAARRLANDGALDEAEGLLSRSVSSSTPSIILDMLARVMVRKGEFEKARELWMTILEREPDNQAAKSALSRLRTPWLAIAIAKRISILAAISLGLTLAAVGFFALSGPWYYPDRPPRNSGQTKLIETSYLTETAPHAKASPKNMHVPALSDEISSTPSKLARRRPPPFFSIPGATVTTNMMETQVVLHEGLFSYRCELAESARPRLKAVGRAIAEYALNCWVIVEGHTDSDPLPATSPFKDNYALGLQRAVAAVEVLHTTPIPAQDILIASAGNRPPIFPGDDYKTKPRNRTVVIRLSPKTITDERTGEAPL